MMSVLLYFLVVSQLQFLLERVCQSIDTLLLLRTLWHKIITYENYSELIIFGKVTNLTRNSLKMSLFPGHLESAKSLQNYEK